MKVIAKLVVIVNEYFHPANKQVLYDRLLLLDLYALLVVTILTYMYAKDDLDEVIFLVLCLFLLSIPRVRKWLKNFVSNGDEH